MTHTRARRWTPIVGSFLVYLTPIFGPHASWFLGEALLAEAGSSRPWAWVAADIGIALAAQLLVWLLLRWSLQGPAVRRLSWLALVPVAGALNVAYMVTIPSYFLIEPDTAPELNTWAERCLINGAPIVPIRTGVTQPESGMRAWWSQGADGAYLLVRVPECTATAAAIPRPTLQPGGRVTFLIGPAFARPDGAAIVEQTDTSSSRRTWSYLAEPGAPLVAIEVPSNAEGTPILSSRSDAIAWMRRIAGSGPPVLHRVLVRPAGPASSAGEVDIDLTPLGPASYTLLDVDTQAREVLLWRTDHPIVVGFDGRERAVPYSPGEVRAQPSTYLRLGDGWVAWDAYRDEGPYAVAWSLGSRDGIRRTNAGRSITSVAVDPSGTFIAVSETTALSIGDARDVVWVARTDTGAEVFRKYLPRYARSQVVFFEGGFFGYSDLDGTHVLTLPGM